MRYPGPLRGRFITLEGIDGAGKTTIAHRVGSELRKKGHRVVLTTEPTRTWLGDAVKKSYDDDVGPLAETFLFLADRARPTAQIEEWLPPGAPRGPLAFCTQGMGWRPFPCGRAPGSAYVDPA